jgi:FAD/FMN-containing dehydrogenase
LPRRRGRNRGGRACARCRPAGRRSRNGRGAAFSFNINGNSKTGEGFEAEREWARAYWSELEPHHTSVYVNFLMEEGEDRIRQAYGAEKYARLKALKRTYDPANLFRLNQNLRPD